jgi:aldehyde:ferredoxin oxidoreductase
MLMPMRNLPGFRGHMKALEKGDAAEKQRRTVPFDDMIAEYYRLRDIDEQGRPSRRRLEEVGLKDVADALHG